MKKYKVVYVERQPFKSCSIEKAFRGIALNLSSDFDFEFQQVPYGPRFLDTVRNLLFFRKRNADVYHITGHVHYISFLFDPQKTVLSIMDVGFLYSKRGLRRWLLKKLYLDWPLRRLETVTAISEHTRSEIIRLAGPVANKVQVLELPLLVDTGPDAETSTFNQTKPLILQIGTSPNKNVPNLARALKGINCSLRIIGPLSYEILNALDENNIEYSNAFGLSDEQIIEEYRRADIVAFCSFYEGFGLPIIEAQASGKPVITSNLSPMTETAGEAAVFVDPNNVTSIKNGLQKLLKDSELRNRLVDAGRKNVGRFTPKNVAITYEKLYTKMLSEIIQREQQHASSDDQRTSSL